MWNLERDVFLFVRDDGVSFVFFRERETLKFQRIFSDLKKMCVSERREKP